MTGPPGGAGPEVILYWLGLALLLSSGATIWALLRRWKLRITRAEADRAAWARTPLQDPFVAAVADGAGFSADRGTVRLSIEGGADGRVIARVPVEVAEHDLPPRWRERSEEVFGVRPILEHGPGFTTFSVPVAACPSAFERLCLAAALVDATDPWPLPEELLAGGVSLFVKGREHGALPPFGVIARGPDGLILHARGRLSHRRDDAVRLDLHRRVLPLPAAALRAAAATVPADLEIPCRIRVLGGNPESIRGLALRATSDPFETPPSSRPGRPAQPPAASRGKGTSSSTPNSRA